jgi:hypothetical protein
MTYKEYKTIREDLENQIKKLEADYLEEHGLAIGTTVIFLGKGGGGYNHSCVGGLYHVAQREIGFSGEIQHNILPARKDGTAAKKGAFIYFCYKQHLQVQV